MKEIGEKLKETRESIGVSIEEASEDLKISASEIESVEAGDVKAFKDIFALKQFIYDYSKYLGLNCEEMVDEFNEYLFDYTSKLSLEEIKKADETDKKMKAKVDKFSSPYTIEHNRKRIIPPIIIWILVACVICIAGYFVYDAYHKEPIKNDNNNIIE